MRIILLCLGFSNISHVDSLYRFGKSVVDKFRTALCVLKKYYDSKENNMKIQYSHEFIQNMGLSDPTTCFYQLIFDENDSNYTKIIQYFIMHGPSALIARSTIITHEYDDIVIKYMVKSYLYCLA